MDTKALQLASRFALPPNSLGYCGRVKAAAKFQRCIVKGKCGGIEKEINKFIVFEPYLKTISKILKLKKYSYGIVEAYCFGNDRLKDINNKDYDILLQNFRIQGVPSWLIKELKKKAPKKFIPNHLFQVLHIGVGKASGSVPFNIKTVNNCMVRWGRVEEIGKRKLTIILNSLKKNNKHFNLIRVKGSYPYRLDFLPKLKSGDFVAVHWNQVVKKLTNTEVENLEYWTKEVLSSL